jgi:hypothetical protein
MGDIEHSGFRRFLFQQRSSNRDKKRENTPMHELMIAASFIAMVLAPCIVAMRSGNGVDNEA